MPHYYSQNGEDFLLDEIFKNKQVGFFVEVGCIDGKRFSNTFFFEEKGWKGMCIEAHKDYIKLIKKNRPESIVVNCAIGEKDEDNVAFYANSRGTLSSLDKTIEEKWKKEYAQYFSGFEEQIINKRTLTTIFDQHHIKKIDILSIDIEGYEVEALQGLNFNKFKPKVIVVESDGKIHKNNIEQILFLHGYSFLCNCSQNNFYTTDNTLRKQIKNKLFKNINLIHTQHPLDCDGDVTEIISINTHNSSTISTKLLSLKLKFFKYIAKIKKSPNKKKNRKLSNFFDIGFHGDNYLIDIVCSCAKHTQQFIETGTNVGSTFCFFARIFPDITCYSCEPDKEAFNFAKSKARKYKNTHLYNELSPGFLYNLTTKVPSILRKKTIFWLDSHGYGFNWPLKEEIDFITRHFKCAYILIDDFLVPDNPQFLFDHYNDQICSFEYIKGSLNRSLQYKIYYPAYNEKTSKHHPLKGWVLIEFGNSEILEIPERLKGKIRTIKYVPKD